MTIDKLETWPTDKRGKGEATKALQVLCELADLHGVALCGTIQPYGNEFEDHVRLSVWLARHGFQATDSTPTETQFYRPPRADAIEHVAHA